MIVTVEYDIGYSSHVMELEFDDDATDEQIEEEARDLVQERLEWSWEREQKNG